MDIIESLNRLISDKYHNGMTDDEIANELGCSHQQINHLRNGRRSFAKMKLETVLRLFPNIRISLDSSPITATTSAVNAGINNGSMTVHNGSSSSESLKSAIRSAILSSDMCSDCKVKILTLMESL